METKRVRLAVFYEPPEKCESSALVIGLLELAELEAEILVNVAEYGANLGMLYWLRSQGLVGPRYPVLIDLDADEAVILYAPSTHTEILAFMIRGRMISAQEAESICACVSYDHSQDHS